MKTWEKLLLVERNIMPIECSKPRIALRDNGLKINQNNEEIKTKTLFLQGTKSH